MKTYARGHHPNCRKNQFGKKPAWNKGLKKGDHPSIERMGYQPGHEPYNDWSHVNAALRDDPEVRARWLESKKGQVAWNKGLTRDQYPNGIVSGPDHGNWDGGGRGFHDTAEYQRFRKSIFQRDHYTCQDCGSRNHRGRGRTVRLEVHHIEAVWKAPHRVYDPTNVRTLCSPCHHRTETFGAKGAKLKRLTSGGS